VKQFGVSLKNYSRQQILNMKLEDIVKGSLSSALKGELKTENTFPISIKDSGISELDSGIKKGRMLYKSTRLNGVGDTLLEQSALAKTDVTNVQNTINISKKLKLDEFIENLNKAID